MSYEYPEGTPDCVITLSPQHADRLYDWLNEEAMTGAWDENEAAYDLEHQLGSWRRIHGAV